MPSLRRVGAQSSQFACHTLFQRFQELLDRLTLGVDLSIRQVPPMLPRNLKKLMTFAVRGTDIAALLPRDNVSTLPTEKYSRANPAFEQGASLPRQLEQWRVVWKNGV